MQLLPAIDLLAGRVVRLYQGDYARETVYDADPVAVALSLVGDGARFLHIVDLEGARAGRPAHLAVLAAIREAVPVPIHYGGGLRTLADVAEALDSGATRVMLGTAALRDPGFLGEVLESLGGGRVLVGLDIKGGRLQVAGWQEEESAGDPVEVARHLVARGVQAFLVTAVGRDGTMAGPDVDTLRLFASLGAGIYAAGGIGGVDDLRTLCREGYVTGAVVGRALYEGRIPRNLLGGEGLCSQND